MSVDIRIFSSFEINSAGFNRLDLGLKYCIKITIKQHAEPTKKKVINHLHGIIEMQMFPHISFVLNCFHCGLFIVLFLASVVLMLYKVMKDG